MDETFEDMLQRIIQRELGTDGLKHYLNKTKINADDYLIELADEEYQAISGAELQEIYDSAEESDGFTGIRLVGKIKELGKFIDKGEGKWV